LLGYNCNIFVFYYIFFVLLKDYFHCNVFFILIHIYLFFITYFLFYWRIIFIVMYLNKYVTIITQQIISNIACISTSSSLHDKNSK
jgi:hypothetical protein